MPKTTFNKQISLIDRLLTVRWMGMALTALLVLAVYAVMLNAPFRTLDDSITIVNNPLIRDFHNIPQIFSTSFFGDHSYYRPLVLFSYMLEYHLFGLNSFFYNLDNVILHLLNAFWVYALIIRLCKDRSTAFWVSVLFAVHPVQWEAVANISGRVIVLNTFFLLASFCWFIDFQATGRRGKLCASLIMFFLALLCKESAAMLPAVLGLYLWLSLPSGEKRPWGAVAPYFILVAAMIIWRRGLGITELFGWGSLKAALLGFLTFATGVITYLRLFIVPMDLYFDRSMPVFADLTDPQIWAAVTFWALLALLLWRNRSLLKPVVFFFLGWFALELAPVSQIVTSVGVQPGFISLAEHFLYVPSIAALTILVMIVRNMWNENSVHRWVSTPVAGFMIAGCLVFLLLTTVQQNIYASNDGAMFRRSLEFQPVNSRVQYSMGMHYVKKGRFREAEQYFAQAVLHDPWNVRARIALAKSLCDQGRLDDGIAIYRSIHDAGALQGLLDENLRLSLKLKRDLEDPIIITDTPDAVYQ